LPRGHAGKEKCLPSLHRSRLGLRVYGDNDGDGFRSPPDLRKWIRQAPKSGQLYFSAWSGQS